MYKKIISGANCRLVLFKENDEELVEVIYNIFNERDIQPFLNPAYMKYRTKTRIRKWIKEKTADPVEVWYAIKSKKRYIGYICFKWRKHYDEACEISTAIDKNFRGLKLGFESSKLLIDYILSLNKFRYIVGYVHRENPRAANNLKKLGFRRSDHLQKIVTIQFYNDDGTSETGRRYILYAINSHSRKPRR